MRRVLAIASLALALTACNDRYGMSGRSLSPIPPKTLALMSERGMTKSDPILVRLYKKESELEIWKRGVDGKYAVLKSYPICRWSGQLGPKRKEGDRQAPEGFYTVTPGQMNPNSAYYLSFDTGYPNAYDRAHGGTGSQLMVHGSCSSRGCYAMTDEGIAEVYALAREAFSGGQRGFQLQAYPFRMTAENLARYRHDPNMTFWKNLKEGSDHFEVTGLEPRVAVCDAKYAFDTVGQSCKVDPAVAAVVAEKQEQDRIQVAELIAKGVPAVRLVYADGGGHESFRATMAAVGGSDSGREFAILDSRPRRQLGDVSRPDALAEGAREIPIDPTGKPLAEKPIQVAAAPAASHAAAARPSERLASLTARPTQPAGSRLQVASAEVDTPSAAPVTASAEDKPLYQRMLANVFGGGESRAEPAEAAGTPASPAAEAPVPPRRGAALVIPNARASASPAARPVPAAVKPQAAAAKPEKHVDAGIIPGASAGAGPLPGGFSRN
ncbi:MAG: murein L,D-transpeptidase [Methylobacteriaceae bacterium]|nr:murein L,D-transpeptidase [Methylobacteriaceae bacterium]